MHTHPKILDLDPHTTRSQSIQNYTNTQSLLINQVRQTQWGITSTSKHTKRQLAHIKRNKKPTHTKQSLHTWESRRLTDYNTNISTLNQHIRSTTNYDGICSSVTHIRTQTRKQILKLKKIFMFLDSNELIKTILE